MIAATELLPKMATYKLAKHGLFPIPRPLTLTYSITSACQSLCQSCNIGLVYQKNPTLARDDLTLEEIEKIFKSLGHVYFFNISGGEPFLRQDIHEIVRLACTYLTPKVIHTPTNALMPQLIEKRTRKILDVMKEEGFGDVPFTIKPSYDGIGHRHDELRGVKGNFEKLMDTLNRLFALRKDYPNLKVGLGTVISKMNLKDIPDVVAFASTLPLDTYINEVAEQRFEMFNTNNPITPTAEEYRRAVEHFKNYSEGRLKDSKDVSKAMFAFRLIYYELTIKTLAEKRQVIPCYGGISNVHLNAKGEVWPCCVLGYSKPLGNLREAGYDFDNVWHSEQAKDVRRHIHEKKCGCPLANQMYSNILLDPASMTKVAAKILFS